MGTLVSLSCPTCPSGIMPPVPESGISPREVIQKRQTNKPLSSAGWKKGVPVSVSWAAFITTGTCGNNLGLTGPHLGSWHPCHRCRSSPQLPTASWAPAVLRAQQSSSPRPSRDPAAPGITLGIWQTYGFASFRVFVTFSGSVLLSDDLPKDRISQIIMLFLALGESYWISLSSPELYLVWIDHLLGIAAVPFGRPQHPAAAAMTGSTHCPTGAMRFFIHKLKTSKGFIFE